MINLYVAATSPLKLACIWSLCFRYWEQSSSSIRGLTGLCWLFLFGRILLLRGMLRQRSIFSTDSSQFSFLWSSSMEFSSWSFSWRLWTLLRLLVQLPNMLWSVLRPRLYYSHNFILSTLLGDTGGRLLLIKSLKRTIRMRSRHWSDLYILVNSVII